MQLSAQSAHELGLPGRQWMTFDCWKRNGKSLRTKKSRHRQHIHSNVSNIMERMCHYLRHSQHKHNAESHLYAAIKEIDHLEQVSSKRWTEISNNDTGVDEDTNGDAESTENLSNCTTTHTATAERTRIEPPKFVPYKGWYALDAVKARLRQLEMSIPQQLYTMKLDAQKRAIKHGSDDAKKEPSTNDKKSHCDGARARALCLFECVSSSLNSRPLRPQVPSIGEMLTRAGDDAEPGAGYSSVQQLCWIFFVACYFWSLRYHRI